MGGILHLVWVLFGLLLATIGEPGTADHPLDHGPLSAPAYRMSRCDKHACRPGQYCVAKFQGCECGGYEVVGPDYTCSTAPQILADSVSNKQGYVWWNKRWHPISRWGPKQTPNGLFWTVFNIEPGGGCLWDWDCAANEMCVCSGHAGKCSPGLRAEESQCRAPKALRKP